MKILIYSLRLLFGRRGGEEEKTKQIKLKRKQRTRVTHIEKTWLPGRRIWPVSQRLAYWPNLFGGRGERKKMLTPKRLSDDWCPFTTLYTKRRIFFLSVMIPSTCDFHLRLKVIFIFYFLSLLLFSSNFFRSMPGKFNCKMI